MGMKRICRHPECEVEVSGNHLLCIAHWLELPAKVKCAIEERIHGWRNREAAEAYLAWHYSAKAAELRRTLTGGGAL